MKKIILPILLFLMFIPYIVNAETCNTGKISISSITVRDKSENVIELQKATADGKNIYLKLSMSEVGDYIKYKVIVKNDSNNNYELDQDSFNLDSNYIDYKFESEDNSNIIKSKSSKVVYLKINYDNKVPDEDFEKGLYDDSNTMSVQLSSNTLSNPKTGYSSYILIITTLLVISSSLYIIINKEKYRKFMIVVIAATVIIPISTYAICKCEININSSIIIKSSRYYIYSYSMPEPIHIGYGIKHWDDSKYNNLLPNKMGWSDIDSFYEYYVNYQDLVNDKNTDVFMRHTIEVTPRYCIVNNHYNSCDEYLYFEKLDQCKEKIALEGNPETDKCEKQLFDVITEAHLGFIYKGRDYYLQASGATYDNTLHNYNKDSIYWEDNKEVMLNAFNVKFGYSYCDNITGCVGLDDGGYMTGTDNSERIYIEEWLTGYIVANDRNFNQCFINPNGFGGCSVRS